MNRYARDMLMRRNRDMRNPYGSAGGYVSSDRNMGNDYARNGRNQDYNMRNDYNYRNGNGYNNRNDYAEYNNRQDYMGYAEHDYANNTMGGKQYGQSNRDYNYEQDGHYPMSQGTTYFPIEAMGTFNGYYGMGNDYNYGRDYGEDYRRDYGAKLTSKDIKKWEKGLENADGTKGKKYEVDQVRQVAQQHNIRFEEYSPELLTAITNMLYSDYCKVLGGDLMVYVKLAKAFLEDDDFEGEPEEKAMLYYKCIVSKDDD